MMMNLHMGRIGFLSVVVLVGFSGCTADAASTESVGKASDELFITRVGTVTPIAFANGSRLLSITAQGTGCPRDAESYSVDIAPDGRAFTVTFSQYEAKIGAGEAVRTLDCQLNVKVNTPKGRTFAVGSVSYAGSVFLEKPGMRASQQSWSYFQGAPVAPTQRATTWPGPVDEDHLQTDAVETADLVWKPCGTERSLQVPTKIKIYNSPARDGRGHIISSRHTFRLLFDQCH
jgi:hypothetical protein